MCEHLIRKAKIVQLKKFINNKSDGWRLIVRIIAY